MDENVNTLGNNKYSILIQDGGNWARNCGSGQ
jgi:hypothetical protein